MASVDRRATQEYRVARASSMWISPYIWFKLQIISMHILVCTFNTLCIFNDQDQKDLNNISFNHFLPIACGKKEHERLQCAITNALQP